MSEPLNTQAIPNERPPTSAHLAFLYSLALPGLGECYAKSWFKGFVSLLGLVSLCAWTTILVKRAFEFLLHGAHVAFSPSDLLAVYGLYALWLWSMFAAVDSARARRREEGQAPQTSVIWATFFAWLSPGAAQAYVGKTGYGHCLFAAFLLGTALEIPMLRHVAEALAPAFKSSWTANPQALIALFNEAAIRIKLNLATALKELTVYASVFLAVYDLQSVWRRQLAEDTNPDFVFSEESAPPRKVRKRLPFPRTTEGRALGLAFLSWVCPGSGQLLLGQTRLAWTIVAVYALGRAGVAGLLAAGWIAPLTADGLNWAPSLLAFFAILHAVYVVVAKPASVSPA